MRTHKGSAQPNPNSPNKSRTRIRHAHVDRSPIYTSGEVFSDGASIELIQEAATQRLCLAVSDGEDCRIASQIEFRGRVYQPPDINPSILRAIKLPSQYGHFKSTAELFTSVQQLLMSRGFPEEAASIASYVSFATWCVEFLPVAPCLLIAGSRPEAVLLLQLLGCLVRRPLPLGEVTRRGLCSLPMDLQLTLLIDQKRISRSVWDLLSASNRRSANIVRNDGLVNILCAKAIYCGDAVQIDNFGDCTLQINLLPSHGRMPILDDKDEREISEEFQAKMLAYRSRNIAKVRESQFDLPNFSSGIRILGRALGASIVDAPEIQAGLCPLLRAYEEARKTSLWLDPRCVVIEAALYHCHEASNKRVLVGEITKTSSTIFRGRGEARQLEAREIGALLRALGLYAKRGGKGYALRLDDGVRRYIHQLAHRYEVATTQEGVAQCSHCAEILGAGDAEGSRGSRLTER